MKKIICLMLVLVLIAFSACGNGADDNNDNLVNDANSQSTSNAGSDNNGNNDNNAVSGLAEITVDDVMSAPESPASDFSYSVLDGNVWISRYNGSDDIVVIPETIDGYPVTVVEGGAFSNDCAGRAVKLADNIIELGNSAFGNNNNIEIVVCGSGLKKIGMTVFNFCDSLKTVVLNDGLESINGPAISGCKNLSEITIPASVTTIYITSVINCPNVLVKVYAGSAAEQVAVEGNWNYEVI